MLEVKEDKRAICISCCLYFYNRTANQIRLYGDKVYLFHNKDLITVIQVPNNLVKHIKNKKVERDG